MEICGAAIRDTSALIEMSQDTNTALETLITSTTTKRNTLNELRKTIYDKSYQNITLTKKLLTATVAEAELITEIATIKRSNGYSGRGSGGRGDNQSISWLRRPLEKNGYCWTHGFKVS